MSKHLSKRVSTAREEGFTLIELLIVIVILGILAGIVVFAVGTARSDSVAKSCAADAKTVNTAAEAYKAKFKDYPTAMTDLVPGFMKAVPNGGGDYTIGYSAGTATCTVT